jgi:uncharacterized membrane protein
MNNNIVVDCFNVYFQHKVKIYTFGIINEIG